ncbi:hypothetical protein Ancab_035885 [Ancistrocladus abbreviatus]
MESYGVVRLSILEAPGHIVAYCRDRLRTKDKLLRWGLQIDPRCVLCGRADESHVSSYEDQRGPVQQRRWELWFTKVSGVSLAKYRKTIHVMRRPAITYGRNNLRFNVVSTVHLRIKIVPTELRAL